LINQRSDVFLVDIVSQNELIHVNSNDIDCIFKIRVLEKRPKIGIEDSESLMKQKDALLSSIALEEKMQKATEKILSVTTDSQKVTTIAQLDACNKRLRALRAEYDKLNAPINVFSFKIEHSIERF
jgi:hypothetical protein